LQYKFLDHIIYMSHSVKAVGFCYLACCHHRNNDPEDLCRHGTLFPSCLPLKRAFSGCRASSSIKSAL
jgi:hypothetical protein